MADILELVKQEMRLNNFGLLRLSGIPRDAVLDELAYCFYPEVHEEQVASYGAVFCGRPFPESLEVKLIPIATPEMGVSRRFADGRRSFLIYCPTTEPKLGIFDSAFGDEYRLLQLSSAVSGLVLQRQQTGLVKLVQNGEIYTVRARTWSRKESIEEAYNRILACLGSAPSPNLREVILGLYRVLLSFNLSRLAVILLLYVFCIDNW